MALINDAQYQPTPRDMLVALKAIADTTEKLTGKTPNILVGTSKLYPPKTGQVMSKKAAVAAHEALYGGKGAVIIKDGSIPVFKQTNGSITKDELGLEKQINPTQINEAREKYQDLLDSHPLSENFPKMNYEDRMALPIVEQKMADKMVAEMAVKEGITPEAFGEILAQGSAFVDDNLDVTIPNDGPSISEGLAYLAEAGTNYREALAAAIAPPVEEQKPKPPSLDDALEADPPVAEVAEDIVLDIPLPLDAVETEIATPEPVAVDETIAAQTEDAIAEPVEEIAEQTALVLDDETIQLSEVNLKAEASELITEKVAPIQEAMPEMKAEPIDLDQISANLTPDGRFASGTTPASEPIEATIAQLTSKIEDLQAEIKSMKKTMDKIANKEPIPKIKSWAQKQANGIMNKMQDRAKVDIVKTVNFGKDLAQKAMDKIAQKAGEFEGSTLKVDGIAKDLKSMFEIHDNAPTVTVGDYTATNDDGKISVNHKDRGEVFAISDKGASFKGNFNADDYRMLSSVKQAVAVIAGPAAVAAEVAQDLAVGAIKEGAKTNAIKM